MKKSTKQTDRTAAQAVLVTLVQAERHGSAGVLTESQARKLIGEIVERTTGEVMQFHSCREWLNEWCESKKGATSERTMLKYNQICREFLEHLGTKADLALGAITPKDVRSFRDTLAKAGHSPTTVNQTVRKVLSAPFIAAQRLGYISTNPCIAVEALKDDADTVRDVFTPEQVNQLLKHASEEWKGVILAGFYTGLRLRDITGLCWESIDLDAGLIKVKTRKTGAGVMVPLHQDFAQWLSKQDRGIGKAPVFKSLSTQSGTGRSGLSMQFKEIMKNAGIVGRVLREKSGKEAQGRTQMSLTFHSLRHSFVSALANAGVAQELRQRLAGHSDAKTHARYTHHEIAQLKDAVEKLPGMAG